MYLKTKILTVLAAGAMMATIGVAPASAAPPVAERTVISQVGHESVLPEVTGTLADGSTFVGELSDLTASVVGGAVQLTGTVSGTLTDLAGNVTELEPADFTTTLPTGTGGGQQGACDILNLDLGPLDLDVLGLVIELDPVVLDITAVSGSGKLVGNLLCAVVGLLDRGVGLNAVSNLLNRIFDAVGLAA